MLLNRVELTLIWKFFYILLDTIDKDLSCSSDIQTGKRSTRKTKKSEELEIPMGFSKNGKEKNGMPLKRKNKIEKKPDDELRYDHIDHIPDVDKNLNATRCKNDHCTGKSHIWCTKCGVHLCLLSKRNCYADFHTKSD